MDKSSLLLALALALALLIAIPDSSAALTLRVSENFATIQAALDSSSTGDDVNVSTGTYQERLAFTDHAVILHSRTNDPATTILDGSFLSTGSLIDFPGNPIGERAVVGFTIRNAPRGISIRTTAILGTHRLQNNHFENNGPTSAVTALGAQVEVLDCTSTGNRSVLFGGAIYILGQQARFGSQIDIFDNFFEGNRTIDYGGATFVASDYVVTIKGNRFVNNHADACAGAVYVAGRAAKNVLIERNTFTGNSSLLGASVGIDVAGGCVVRGNTIVGSTGGLEAEGIRVEQSLTSHSRTISSPQEAEQVLDGLVRPAL